MDFIILSFLAGVLTVFAPCVFTLLPITLGSSLNGGHSSRTFRIVMSLLVSIFIFTLLLKVSSSIIDLPITFWRTVSGGIILIYGVITIFPQIWEKIKEKVASIPFFTRKSLGASLKLKNEDSPSLFSDILIGASLGPTFSSCSPTYALIVAIILPVSFGEGILSLLFYLLGLGSLLFIIAYLGRRFTSRFIWALNPLGLFRRGLGVLFVVIGVSILLGWDKQFETYLIKEGIYQPSQIELDYIQKVIN